MKHEFVELGKTVRYRPYTHIAGRMVSHRSHKPSVSGSTPDPATKKIWNIKKYFLSLLKYREIVAAVARKAHNLEVGGSIPPLATKTLNYGKNVKKSG